MKKIGQFLIILISLCIFLTCDMQRADFLTPLSPVINAKNLQSIQITRASNPQLPADGLTVINGNDITIYLSPDINSDTDSFILDIQAEGYDHFSVEGQTVQSGSTEIVFGHDVPRNFTIHGSDESTTEYTLRVVETLIGQVYSYDPRGNAPTEDQYFNTTVPFYVEFNSSIDAASLVSSDFSINGGFAVSQISSINERIFIVDVDSVSTTPREDQVTLVLEPHTVQDDDQTSTAVLNQNQSSSSVQWDSLPPGFNGIVEVEELNEGNTNLELRLYPWEDGVFPQDELRYSLFYSKGSAPGLNDAPLLNLNTLTSGTSVLEDFSIGTTYYDVNVTGLEGQYKYCYFLKVQDALGNQALYQYDHMQSSFVYVSIQNGDNSTATGNIDAPFRDIQPAIEYAESHGIREVLVAEGTYSVVPDTYTPGPAIDRVTLTLHGNMKLRGGYSLDFSSRDIEYPYDFPTVISGHIPASISGGGTSKRLIEHSYIQATDNPPNSDTLLEGFVLQDVTHDTSNGGAAIANAGSGFHVKACHFINLHSPNGAGGAISLWDIGDTFLIENSRFENCSSIIGGAIASRTGNSPLRIENCDFIGNIANYVNAHLIIPNNGHGGAIYLEDIHTGAIYHIVTINNSRFDSSTAEIDGGAIYLNNTFIELNNSNSFTSNQAQNNGGAIFTLSRNSSFKDTGSIFQSNSAINNGGAIYSDDASLIELNGTEFNNNFCSSANAGNGGAIAWINSTPVVTNTDMQMFISNCVFDSNKADDADIGTYNHGGAIYTYGPRTPEPNMIVNITQSTFQNNYADSWGGAFFGDKIDFYCNNTAASKSSFSHNAAQDLGGALYLNASMIDISNSDFLANSAIRNINSRGGAIHLTHSQSSQIVDTNFYGNRSNGNGGALSAYVVNLDLTRCHFDSYTSGPTTLQTEASMDGGAIWANSGNTDGRNLTFTEVYINNCIANGNGGAIYFSNSSPITPVNFTSQFNNCEFTNNTSHANGGAIHLENIMDINFSNNLFQDNKASNLGGAMNIKDSAVLLEYSQLSSNFLTSAISEGGGAISIKDGTNRSVTIRENSFSTNRSYDSVPSGQGGALLITANTGKAIEIYNNNFDSNSSDLGGAITASLNLNGSSKALILMGNNYFRNEGINGPGAIYFREQAYADIISEIFIENKSQSTASYQGAAISMVDLGPIGPMDLDKVPNIIQSIFYSNAFTTTPSSTSAESIGLLNNFAQIHNNFFYDPSSPKNSIPEISSDNTDVTTALLLFRNIFCIDDAGGGGFADLLNVAPGDYSDLLNVYNNVTLFEPINEVREPAPSISIGIIDNWRDFNLTPFLVSPTIQLFIKDRPMAAPLSITLPINDITGSPNLRQIGSEIDAGPYELP